MRVIVATFATLFMNLAPTAFASSLHYSIIIDAGSTGSRLHLFQYETENSLPEIKEIFSESIKPGLSSFSHNPEAAGEALKKLLDDATASLKNLSIDPQSVPLSVLATAGMRILPTENQTAIYQSVNHYIKNNYAFPIDQIETITGKMEGVYGWLDVNYLAKNFTDKTNTVGSIDMGGASTQIAFATQDTSKPNDEVTVKIGPNSYTIFSKSFLGLGQDQALAAMNKDTAADTCYPMNYPMSRNSPMGNFNFTVCGSIYADVIRQHHVAEEILPLARQQFIAYSGTFYSFNFLDVTATPDQANVEQRIQSI
jgi:hypothetical protein